MTKHHKEKTIWVDDGRTIADMWGISSSATHSGKPRSSGMPLRTTSPMKEHLRTFFDAIGFMFLPTLAIAGVLFIAFLIVYIIL